VRWIGEKFIPSCSLSGAEMKSREAPARSLSEMDGEKFIPSRSLSGAEMKPREAPASLFGFYFKPVIVFTR